MTFAKAAPTPQINQPNQLFFQARYDQLAGPWWGTDEQMGWQFSIATEQLVGCWTLFNEAWSINFSSYRVINQPDGWSTMINQQTLQKRINLSIQLNSQPIYHHLDSLTHLTHLSIIFHPLSPCDQDSTIVCWGNAKSGGAVPQHIQQLGHLSEGDLSWLGVLPTGQRI